MTPKEFVTRWSQIKLKETAAAQSHFNDICALVGHPLPIVADPKGEFFTFEAKSKKASGGRGRAVVWYKGRFIWEYKAAQADLDKAYQQLLLYRESLENPPLLITSDLVRILIHTNFTGTVKQIHEITLDRLLNGDGLDLLRRAFFEPQTFQPAQTQEKATQATAETFVQVVKTLQDWRQRMLVAGEPVFSEALLTRALLAAQDAGIPALIGLNKTDLPATAAARERLAPYRAMGVEVIELALKADPVGSSARLLAHLAGRTTLVLGASGMGKSTLINLLVPAAAAQVGEISQALAAGRHTTTTSTWYWLDHEHRGALIDTPGFQEFGLRHIEQNRLATLMPDFAAALGHCRFHNCSHRHEPGCGVRAAMASGERSASRQRIYEMLFEELSRPRW